MSAHLSCLTMLVLATGLSACDGAEADPERFQKAAERVAAIPINPEKTRLEEAAKTPLQVQLMTPHQLWDAREGIRPAAAKVIVVDSQLIDPEAEVMPEAPVAATKPVAAPVLQSVTTIQIGAYATAEAARRAWAGLGKAGQGLTPVYEPVQRGETSLIRLKVRASAERARQICTQAAAADPWCLRASQKGSSTGDA